MSDAYDRPLPEYLDPRRPRRGSHRAAGEGATATRAERRRRQYAKSHPVRSGALRGLRAVSTLVAAALLMGSGLTFAYYNRLTSQAGTAASVQNVEGNQAAEGFDRRDMDILMIGTDTRTGTDIPAEDGSGDDLHNTDTIMLIHVPADGSRASVVSFPRDTWVMLPTGEKSKINSAYASGWESVSAPDATDQQHKDAGQKWLVQTVSGFSGVQIDHFVEVTLAGFRQLTQAVGGVDVNLCEATEDLRYSGANFPAGPQHLDENQALSFVRQRHGLDEHGGDLARIKRQQYFMATILRKVLDRELGDLFDSGKLGGLIDALAGTITFDQDLNPLVLADQMRDVAAGNVEFRTIPLDDPPFATIEGQDAVVPASDTEIKAFFQALSTPAATPEGPPAGQSTSAPGAGASDVASSTSAAGSADATPSAPSSDPGRGSSNYSGTAGASSTAVPPPDITAASENCIY